MDDLMNKVSALIEAHVNDYKCAVAKARKDCDAYRVMWEQLLHAQSEDLKACTERDELRERVRVLEAKLLEVRKVAAQDAPEKHAERSDDEPSEFQKGDLVARHMRDPGCWGTVTDVDGDYVQVLYPREGEGVCWHMERELKRKPVEPGDRVRVTGDLSKGSPFSGRVGTARAKELGGIYGEWRIDKPEGSSFATCARLVVAIAP